MASDPTHHSRRVRRLRQAMLVTALALLVLVLLWSSFGSGTWFDARVTSGPAQAEMIDAVMRGKNQQGQPYILRAQVLRKRPETKSTYDMQAPDIEIGTRRAKDLIQAQAESGVYDQQMQTITLSGTVELRQTGNRTIRAPHVDFNMQNGDFMVQGPLQMESPARRITADLLNSTAENKTHEFTNGVITLFAKEQK